MCGRFSWLLPAPPRPVPCPTCARLHPRHEIKIPRGGDEIQVGDNVIVVTLEHGLHDLRDIVED